MFAQLIHSGAYDVLVNRRSVVEPPATHLTEEYARLPGTAR